MNAKRPIMKDAGDGLLPPPSNEYNLAIWQGRIAHAAKQSGGLDVFKAALEAIRQNPPLDASFFERAKAEIWGAAERHLADVHGFDILEAIYYATFPSDAEQG